MRILENVVKCIWKKSCLIKQFSLSSWKGSYWWKTVLNVFDVLAKFLRQALSSFFFRNPLAQWFFLGMPSCIMMVQTMVQKYLFYYFFWSFHKEKAFLQYGSFRALEQYFSENFLSQLTLKKWRKWFVTGMKPFDLKSVPDLNFSLNFEYPN